jgi:hypothetical protein
MELGQLAEDAGKRLRMLHDAFVATLEGGDSEAIANLGNTISQSLQDWCRICQIPMPPRPKVGDQLRPMIDISPGSDGSMSDDQLVTLLRGKSKGPGPGPGPGSTIVVPESSSSSSSVVMSTPCPQPSVDCPQMSTPVHKMSTMSTMSTLAPVDTGVLPSDSDV